MPQVALRFLFRLGPWKHWTVAIILKPVLFPPSALATMAAHLLDAPLDVGGFSDSDEEPPCAPSPGGVIEVQSPAAEQTHLLGEAAAPGGVAAALALVATPSNERKRQTLNKKAQGDECPKEKRIDKAMSQLAQQADMVKCVYHCGTCIPIWPQYQKVAAGSHYLKVAPYEQWFVDYVGPAKARQKGFKSQQTVDKHKYRQDFKFNAL